MASDILSRVKKMDAIKGNHARVLLHGIPGSGKRVTVDTPVLTPSGWVRNGDLIVGDAVIGASGQPTQVTGVHDHGVGPAYRITFNDGSWVIADGDHQWSVSTRKMRATTGNRVTLTTQQMIDLGIRYEKGGNAKPFYQFFLPLMEPAAFDVNPTLELDPYVLGALLANGYLEGGATHFTSNEQHIADRVLEGHEIKEEINEAYTVRRWKLPKIYDKTRDLGIDGLRSAEKFIPSKYLFASVEERVALLHGLMDCDGSVMPRKRAIYHSRSLALSEGVQKLVWSLGGVARIDHTVRDGETDYQTQVWLPFNPFSLPRKADRYTPRPWFRAIDRIEPAGEHEMRCISVAADDELYVTKDYIVTHNTSLAATMARQGKVLYLYTKGEEGINSLRGIEGIDNIDIVRIEALEDLTELTRVFVGGKHDYYCVIVDTVSALQQMWADELLKKGGFSVRRSQATRDFDFWGTLKEGMEEFFTFWYGLADHARENPIHVIMTAQTEEKEYNGETRFVPLLQGKAWKTLLARPDHIFFTHLEEHSEDADKYVHVVRVKPSAEVYAKLRVSPKVGEKVPDIMGRKGQLILPEFLAQMGVAGLKRKARPKKAATKTTKKTTAVKKTA